MFMRFVTLKVDEDSHQSQGIFQLAYALLQSGDLSKEEYAELETIVGWFEKNLPSPDYPHAEGRATFWFKSSAADCITRVWQLVNILRIYDNAIELQTCWQLGNVRYSDQHQVAAYPSSGDGRVITKTI